jgi:hypothetical protein
MTTVYKIPLQCWVGSTDVNDMLSEIGGWQVGCYNEREARQAVELAKSMGWVQLRTHYGPAYPPDGVPAYEVTDAGLQRIEDSWGPEARKSAEEIRQLYRDSAVRAHGQTGSEK